VIGAEVKQGPGSFDGADDGRGLHGLDAVDRAEAVRDVVVQVGVVAAAARAVGSVLAGAQRNRMNQSVRPSRRLSDGPTTRITPWLRSRR
jgi:hypothetical protein